jgi:hypothetical protein
MRLDRANRPERHRPGRSPDRRRGFTLVDVVVASVLASVLGVLLAMAFKTFGRPALEVEARARIAQEGILAAQSLACDLGGFLADPSGRAGTFQQGQGSPGPYQFSDWVLTNENLLWLNFQGASPGNTITIKYEITPDPFYENQSPTRYLLVRTDSSTGVATTVAKYVTAFTVAPNPDNSNQALIQITFSFRDWTATYTLIGVSPS